MLCDNPLFIVGAPRSGTTLLRSMLDAHPGICCPTWETGLFDRLGLFLAGDFSKPRGTEANFCPLRREQLVGWMRHSTDQLIEMMITAAGKPRWGEKTPAHVFHMELIGEVYPRAQFIHIVRNGRDVVRSLQNVEWSPRNIGWSVRRWTDSIAAGRAASERLGPDRYTEVRYEDLTSEPETTLRRLCQFLREPYESQMLDFHNPSNNSWGLAMDKIHSQSVYKKKYRDLSFVERLVLKLMAGRLMRELGYR